MAQLFLVDIEYAVESKSISKGIRISNSNSKHLLLQCLTFVSDIAHEISILGAISARIEQHKTELNGIGWLRCGEESREEEGI